MQSPSSSGYQAPSLFLIASRNNISAAVCSSVASSQGRDTTWGAGLSPVLQPGRGDKPPCTDTSFPVPSPFLQCWQKVVERQEFIHLCIVFRLFGEAASSGLPAGVLQTSKQHQCSFEDGLCFGNRCSSAGTRRRCGGSARTSCSSTGCGLQPGHPRAESHSG